MKSGVSPLFQKNPGQCVLLMALAMVGFTADSHAQDILVGYDFTMNTAPTTTGAGVTGATNVMEGPGATGGGGFNVEGTIGDNTGLAASGTTFGSILPGSYGKTNVGLGGNSLQAAINGNQYLTFSFAAATPGTLNISNFSVDSGTGGNGNGRAANEFNVIAQVNGGTDFTVGNAIFPADQINGTSGSQANVDWLGHTVDLSGDLTFQGIDSVEFRIYLWGGAGGTAGSRMGFDQLLVEGNINDPEVDVPQPDPILTLVDAGAVGQLVGSAIPMNIAAGQIASQVHGTGLRDLNKRLFRLRNRLGSNGFARASDQGRGREVSASRVLRWEQELRMKSTIDLSGAGRKPSTPGGDVSDSASSGGGNFFFPSVTVPAGGGANPVESRFETYTSFDYGYYDLNPLGQNAGVQSRTYSGTLGIEYIVSPEFAVGLGLTHVENENNLSGGLGSVDLEGNALSVYGSYFKDNFWGDLLYSQGLYEASINRNTLLGSTVNARPNVHAHQTTLNLGYNIPHGDRVVHGPTFRADYSWGILEGYTERGDPRANTTFQRQDYESLITTPGWQISWKQDAKWGTILPQVRLGYGRENINRETNVTGTLQNSPIAFVQGGNLIGTGGTISNTLTSEDPGEGWMEFGAGIGFEFSNNFSLNFDYQGRFFQQDAQLHYGTVVGSWKF